MKKDVSNNVLEEMFIVDSVNIHDNQLIQNCFDVVSVFVAAIDLEGNISFVNIRATEVLGHTKEEIVGKNFIDNFIMEDKQDETKMLFDSVIAGKSFYDDNTRYFIRGDQNEQRIIESKNVTIRDANKNIYGILSNFLVFCFVNLTYVFFRAETIKDAFYILINSFNFRLGFQNVNLFNFKSDMTISIILIFLLFIIEVLEKNYHIASKIMSSNSIIKIFLLLFGVFSIILLGKWEESAFIYFQF